MTKSKKVQSEVLELLVQDWKDRGGKIKKLPKSTATDYHPYDTDLQHYSNTILNSRFQIKRSV
jgi:hypothetical protein